MENLTAISSKNLWCKRVHLLLLRMSPMTSKKEWDDLEGQSEQIETELKRRGEIDD